MARTKQQNPNARIIAYMKHNGIAKSHVARKIKFSAQGFAQALSGDDMRLQTYLKICKALDKQPCDFLE